MSSSTTSPALRTIFSFFLGLMLTAFVGIGVYTFHPPPERTDDARVAEIDRQQQEIRGSGPADERPEAERERLAELGRERRELEEALRLSRRGWNLSTSIVLIVFSTLLLAGSLLRPEQLPVIANGLLLGGIFSMLYGVGWVANSESSITRFVVMTVALAITIGLGWARFSRRVAPEVAAPVAGDLSALATRVVSLERRLRDAGRRLGEGLED